MGDWESRIMPIVERQKTITSCTVILSPSMRKAMIDVKNGFSNIKMTFDVDVSLSAMKMSK